MYITSGLFLGDETAFPVHKPVASPAMVGFTNSMLGKRRRLEDESSPLKDKVSISALEWSDPIAMKLTLPDTYGPANLYSYHLDSSIPAKTTKNEEPPMAKRRIAPGRRSTAPYMKSQCRPISVTSVPPLGPNSMEPCHRCHRIPRKKKDLLGYTDCERPECNSRTCSVCIRECGCGRRICSSPDCSVEHGEEGTVFCTECYSKRDENNCSDREQEMSE